MTVFTPAQRERHARQKMAAAARRSGSRTNTRIRAGLPTPILRSSRRATMGAWRSSSESGLLHAIGGVDGGGFASESVLDDPTREI